MLAVGADFVDLTVIAGRHIKIAGAVEREVPNVLRAGIVIDGGAPRGILGTLCRLSGFRGAEAIDFAIRSRGCVNDPVLRDHQGLHLQLLGLKDGRDLSVGRDAIDTSRSARGCVYVARRVRSDGPDVGGGRGRQRLKRGGKFEASPAPEGNAVGGAFNQFFEL